MLGAQINLNALMGISPPPPLSSIINKSPGDQAYNSVGISCNSNSYYIIILLYSSYSNYVIDRLKRISIQYFITIMIFNLILSNICNT